jgi:hypothetical protein
MSDEKMTHPRTHRWFRRPDDAPPPRASEDDVVPVIEASVPEGKAVPPGQLQSDIRAALAVWPIVVLRIVGSVKVDELKVGKQPARWLRKDLVGIVDAVLCSCRGDRCVEDRCTANRLLGRHGKTGRADGEAWAPFVVRAADTVTGTLDKGGRIGYELVLVGAATLEIGRLIEAFSQQNQPYDQHPVRWQTVQALALDEERGLRWKKVDPEAAVPPLISIGDLSEPKLRPRRLTMTFLTATPMARQGERGQPSADFALVLDRMTRSLGAWMGRTAHRGPRLPVDDILRASNGSRVTADHRRTLQVPDVLLAAPGARDFRPMAREDSDGTTALLGSITWTGEFAGLAPLLRAIQYLGMGPGRQHGLGQVAFR